MDLSKLPKLSQTERPPGDAAASVETAASSGPTSPRARQVDHERVNAAPGFGAEIWLSAIIGFICVMLGMNFARYTLARVAGTPYHTGVNWLVGPNAGQEVAYPELQGYVMLTESAYFLFGLALIFEAIMLAVITRSARFGGAILTLALLIALIATAYNL